jgi:hypothetical protein
MRAKKIISNWSECRWLQEKMWHFQTAKNTCMSHNRDAKLLAEKMYLKDVYMTTLE